jgi:hypothetical protein
VLLQVSEKGALLGSSDVDRLMLSSGEHVLEFANPSLGFRVERKVTVAAGKTSPVRVDVPNGTVSINAFPWADVFIDGQSVGQTPIANIARPIGRHEVLFRNPQLGERRETIVLTTQQPVRLGVDLRKK